MSTASSRHHRVREIDFRRPSKFNRDHVRRLEHAHDQFCQTAGSRLSAELRTEFQLAVLGTDQLPYSVVMAEEVPRDSLITVMTIDQLDTEIALVVDMALAHCLVSRLLGGGTHGTGGSTAHLTPVEVAVARRAVNSLVDSLSATWEDLADVTLSPESVSLSPMSVQIVPPSEPTLLLNVSAQVDGITSIITLVVPHRSVASLMHIFEQHAYGAIDEDGAAAAEMQDAMGGVNVELRAEVAAVELPLADVLALKPGDVVPLKRNAATGVTLHVGDVPAYVGSPGRDGNKRAVQVREAWSEA